MTQDDLQASAPALFLLLYGHAPSNMQTTQVIAREELDRLVANAKAAVVHECLFHASTLAVDSDERRAFSAVGAWLAKNVPAPATKSR